MTFSLSLSLMSYPFLDHHFACYGQAALVGSKVDVVLPKHKRPKSKYAAGVIREINLRKHLHGDEVTIDYCVVLNFLILN